VNSETQMTKTRICPNCSASFATMGMAMICASAYPVSVHPAQASDVSRSTTSVPSATAMIDESTANMSMLSAARP
jgi:hypothetical protein